MTATEEDYVHIDIPWPKTYFENNFEYTEGDIESTNELAVKMIVDAAGSDGKINKLYITGCVFYELVIPDIITDTLFIKDINLPKSFGNLQSLSNLIIDDFTIYDDVHEISGLQNLKTLTITRGGPIIVKNLPNLTNLTIKTVRCEDDLDCPVIENLPKLKHLDGSFYYWDKFDNPNFGTLFLMKDVNVKIKNLNPEIEYINIDLFEKNHITKTDFFTVLNIVDISELFIDSENAGSMLTHFKLCTSNKNKYIKEKTSFRKDISKDGKVYTIHDMKND